MHRKILTTLTSALLLLALAGCGSADFAGSQGSGTGKIPVKQKGGDDDVKREPPDQIDPKIDPISEEFALDGVTLSDPIDVIFLVDTSGSMSDEKARLEVGMEKFVNDFLVAKEGLDYQLFLIGREFAFPNGVLANTRVDVIDWKIGSHDALDVAARLLDLGLTGQTLPLRPQARKEFVVVTDDNANGRGMRSIYEYMLTKQHGDISMNGLIGLSSSIESSTCKIANVGSAYLELAQNFEPKGLIQDLCLDDWSVLLDNLGEKITAPQEPRFALRRKADQSEGIVVILDGDPLPANKVRYDADENTVTLELDDGERERGGTVIVRYTPKSEDTAGDESGDEDSDDETADDEDPDGDADS